MATKPKRKKATPKAALARRSGPPARVRMYRQGLGDCLLITCDPNGEEQHILVDCGTLGATTTGVTLKDVAADIAQETNGHIHVLIATHEHLDHVIGFLRQRDVFTSMDVDHVWLAWTENPDDPLAQQVAKAKNDLGMALAESIHALAGRYETAASPLALAVQDILGFSAEPEMGAGDFGRTVDEAMHLVRTGLNATVHYLKPGIDPIELPTLLGFRFYILGPPRSEKALYNLGGHGSSELYSLARGLRSAVTFEIAGHGNVGFGMDDRDSLQMLEFEREFPFDRRFQRGLDGSSMPAEYAQTYLGLGQEWRRVSDDWLQVVSDLALQLDSATNNTSLAFAMERIGDRRVLLFPGDAQLGSWVSWHDPSMRWEVPDSASGKRQVTARDLLGRAVFYKVGHHGSHNATAKALGLELMNEDELTAFIPLDRAVALKRNPAGSWKMPARALYSRLLEKCRGRVARSDLGWADDFGNAKDPSVEKEFKGIGSGSDWATWRAAQTSARNVTVDPLYIDYVLE